MKLLHHIAILGWTCCVATAQLALYDAGTAPHPPAAPDPQLQGWSLVRTDPSIGLNSIPGSGGVGPNAWGILDASTVGFAAYGQTVQVPSYFDLSLTVSLAASNDSYGFFFQVQDGLTLGHNSWIVGMQVVGDDIVVTQRGWAGPTVTYVCTDGAVGFHTFQLRKTPSTGFYDALFVYDGRVLGNMESAAPDLSYYGSVRFGTQYQNPSAIARVQIHRVEFRDLFGLVGGGTMCAAVPNSTGLPASASAYGSPLIAGPGFSVHASRLPPGQFGYFLMSFGTGLMPLPGSQGTLCLDPATISRASTPTGALNSGPLGEFFLDFDPLSMPTNPPGPVGAGTLYFQAWFRDGNPGPTSNLSDAVAVTLQ